MGDRDTSILMQSARVRPPRRGSILSLSVDATARAYDLAGFSLAEHDETDSRLVFVVLQACGGDIFYHFADDDPADLDDSSAVAAGDPLTYPTPAAAMIPNGVTHEVQIDRSRDLFLVVKTATSTATLRMWAGSDAL